jgi:LPXTG-motif cell wall-anchored protein
LDLGIAALLLGGVGAVVAAPAGRADSTVGAAPHAVASRGYAVFWDENEEEDFWLSSGGALGRLVGPWDPNGQLCVVPDGSGRFVVGYNPTLASQNNPGSLLPVKQPPVGEAMYDHRGDFTGQTLFVPGPFKLPGQSVGGDIPPDAAGGGAFNNNGTMTGCAFDQRGDLFAVDLGTAQGQFPPPDDGRLIEWFAPRYTSFCVVDGPTAGGIGPHHVDGHGGLRQPGDLAVDPATGDLLVPEAGSPTGGLGGRVLRIDHHSLPRGPSDCGPAGLYPPHQLRVSTFVQGNAAVLPFPQGIARDPSCGCWAVSTVIGNPSVVWFRDNGTPVGRSLRGEDLAHVGQDPLGWNPFGIAFGPDGTLFLVDIHVVCSAPLVNCGPASKAGRVLRFTFHDRVANPPTELASGLDFPTSITVCVPGLQTCPSRIAHVTIGSSDWRGYGHDAQHTFAGSSTLTAATVRSLAPAWFFPTALAVTATPTVVDGVVYVGSWDGFFYAIDLRSGFLRWKYRLADQPAVSPHPGGPPDSGSDGGMVTSSAWFEPGDAHRPDLVIFGGGYSLYALDARTGALYWKHDYTGRPDLAPDPQHDGTRIFSSPVVTDNKVLVGVSNDGQRHERGYIVAADLNTGEPAWTFNTDVDSAGSILNDGCGNVWSSGTVLPDTALAVFDVADCNFSATGPYNETVLALHLRDGTLAWQYRPPRRDDGCDFDFGATANAGLVNGVTDFLGVGGKDGTYYSLDPTTGTARWSTNVVFGGFTGGFIGTTAYDRHHIYGATALGDFGRFETSGPQVCDPSNPRDTQLQEPTAHAFDAHTGAVLWQEQASASFASTTVADAMTLNCLALHPDVDIRAATTGTLVAQLHLRTPCWSGIATTNNALIFGTGSSPTATGNGIAAYTPGGVPPDQTPLANATMASGATETTTNPTAPTTPSTVPPTLPRTGTSPALPTLLGTLACAAGAILTLTRKREIHRS